MLDDGTYDIIVVDAELIQDKTLDGGNVVRLDLTILGGAHRGEIVSLRAAGLEVDEVTALGLPGTLTVREGEPLVVLDQ